MKFSINKKVSLLIITVIFVLGLVLGFYYTQNQTRSLNSELNKRITVLLDYLAYIIEYPLLIKDQEGILKALKGIMAQKEVVSCKIKDKEGNIIYQESSKKEGPVKEFSSCIVTKKVEAKPGEMLILGITKEEKEEIGKIYLTVSLSELNQKITNMRKTIAMVVVITIILGSFVSSLLFRFVLVRPITLLVEATEKIAQGDLNYKVPIKTKDEVGILAASFNKMTDDLQKSNDELVKSKDMEIKLQSAQSSEKARAEALQERAEEVEKAYKELKAKTEQLERFQKITVGRELEMIKLKAEINSLLEKLHLPKKYETPEKTKEI
ncbi:MAG: HAMP domain-containing protein [Elusimicrobiota bacterium]